MHLLLFGKQHLVLVLGKLGHQRFQIVQTFVEHKANGADDFTVRRFDRHARHHERLFAEGHDVENDRLARPHDLPHQAVGDDRLCRQAHHRIRLGNPQQIGVFRTQPDDARPPVHDERTLANLVQMREQGLHGDVADFIGVADEEAPGIAALHVGKALAQGRRSRFLHGLNLITSANTGVAAHALLNSEAMMP
ncbi:MAG: hypothetical protein BWY57_00642 [Betaproteobacteria bacterium ADurb.Bin341]|nr:MAG: hypothetical protein BWY57_00642 [Betaproteobacteria bacterium ADurb.Bin341]